MGVQQAKVDRVHPSTIDLSLTRIEELARREGQSTATGAAGYVSSYFISWFYQQITASVITVTSLSIFIGLNQ